MKRGSMLMVLFLLVVVCLTSDVVLAQSNNATLSGTVVDQNGAAVPGVAVSVINPATSLERNTTSDEHGRFTVPLLPPGSYTLMAKREGFKIVRSENIVLNVNDDRSIKIQLKVGEVTETVDISSEAPLISQSTAVTTVVDQRYIANMPLNGRSFQDLILLTPGVVTNSPQRPASVGMNGEFSVNGQRTDANSYMVDGVSANVGATADANASFYATTGRSGASGSIPGATTLGTTQALVSVDALQEFRVQSSSYSAQYGRSPGGQFAFETKSGTNDWHGTAFNYLRNDVFDATDYFTKYFQALSPEITKNAVRQNDFGGTLGGPVRIPGLYNGKDKTFFFASYEGMRLVLPQAAAASLVPDLCMRGEGSCRAGRAPAAAAVLPVVKSYPLPTAGGTVDLENGVAEFIGSWSNPANIDSFSARVDHNVNSRLGLFFRFSNTSSDSATRGGAAGTMIPPSQVSVNSSTLRTYTAGANTLLSNRITNEFRLNYSSNLADGNVTIEPYGGSSSIDLVGLSGLGDFPRPAVTAAFFLGVNFLQQAVIHTAGAQRQWNVVDTLSVALGRHRLSLGGDYRRLTPYSLPSNPLVFYLYFSEPDVEANNASLFIQQFADAHPLYQNFSLFAQDEWSVSDRLTLSLGLRWEVNPPPGVTEGLMPYTIAFKDNPDDWTLAPQGTPLWKTTWFNFAPRLGIAYVVRNKTGWETVLRAGGGVFFDTGQQPGSLGFEGPGFTSAAQFSFGSFPGNPAAELPPFTDPPSEPFLQLFGFYPHLQLPYTIQWNVSLQQALGKSQAITASYVGSHAGRLLQTNGFRSAIAINPVQVTVNGPGSDYNAMQIQYQRRLSQGLTALASHTWSHCLDYGSSNFLNGYERQNCDFDVRHSFSGALSYDIPYLRQEGIAKALLRDWGVDLRFGARTAFPVDLVGSQVFNPATGERLSNGLDFTGRPIYVFGAECDAIYANNFGSTLSCPGGRAINPDAFRAASGRGNVPRNFARGFGAWQLDMAVRRTFPITERLKLQFRAEAFNAFNHPNLGRINGQFGQSTFGQATATLANSIGGLNQIYQMGGPRSMQFALKLIF
jgi:hypothetical protein